MTQRLAERLKAETRALHTAVERSRFMSVLLRGRMDGADYGGLLRNLHAIYAALEPALMRHARHPMIGPVFLPTLWRTRSLEHDLRVLHGGGWRADFRLQPSAAQYAKRLRELETANPKLLLAHAYVRYLGDLSGGQMLRRIVARSMPAVDGDAASFYDFGDAPQTDALVQAFRAGLARIEATEEDANAIVAEAKLAFQLHQHLFDELADASASIPTERPA